LVEILRLSATMLQCIWNGFSVVANLGATMTRQPLTCPVCRQTATTRLLQEVRITAEVNGAVRDVDAVGAFRCKEKGHIFFVRFKDLEWAEAVTESA
jgi:hypothetical protein